MDKHLVERDREGGVVTVDDHGGGITDETHVYAGGVNVHRGRVIVGCDDRYGLALAVLLL